MQSDSPERTPHKHPCPDCIMCQSCADVRCRACRADKRGKRKRKLSVEEQIALYDSLNPHLRSCCRCKD